MAYALITQGDVENEFVMRFQQFTAPVMAKGVEDTAFYWYNRLVSLNEVGGDPCRFGISIEEFHQRCSETLQKWPKTLLATSTHDTKRSEDVRARLNVLSEIPDQWKEAVQQWSLLNQQHKQNGFPDPNTEYLLYQTLVGAWPIEENRVLAYMEKATREAKVYTSWTKPDPDYEEALSVFVRAIFKDKDFCKALENFVKPLIEPGRMNSLAQTLLKLTAPGVPDIYQGTELWDLSLVDPDNRRPVDYALRRHFLKELNQLTPEKILSRMDDGLPKLWVIRQVLSLRKRNPELFGSQSAYRPLLAQGTKADHVIAFMRGEHVITIVPRLFIGLHGKWGHTAIDIPKGSWRNELTHEELQGGRTRLAKLLEKFPVCLLSIREKEDR